MIYCNKDIAPAIKTDHGAIPVMLSISVELIKGPGPLENELFAF